MARRRTEGATESVLAAFEKPEKLEKTEKLERYEVIQVHRNKLQNAPYNPRVINEKERQRLKTGIKKLGVLSPPTWNKRTGNIVAGHQRIGVMDLINGTQDYKLTVAAVDLSDSQEREANLLMNNPNAQGDWDLGKLHEMFGNTDVPLDLDSTGFDSADIYRLFGDSPVQSQEALDDLADRLRKTHEQYSNVVKKSSNRDSDDFYTVVVFKDEEDRAAFYQEFNLDDNRYQDGREFRRLLSLSKSTTS